MNTALIAEDIAFALSAFIAVAGALGMATTMSMFRSGIFLMASFMGVAALFILLAADLLGLLQIMMYIGGMLVMILFMVLFMPDPGGAMMAGMPEMMSPVEKLFSLGLAPRKRNDHAGAQHEHGEAHAEGEGGHQEHDHEMAHGGGEMDMSGMAMVTPVRPLAVGIAAASGLLLIALLLLRAPWTVSPATPDSRSAEQVGSLLMDKYMIAFEGAGFLILIGIFGGVFAGRPDRHPGARDRGGRAATAEPPPAIAADDLVPLARPMPEDKGDSGQKPPS